MNGETLEEIICSRKESIIRIPENGIRSEELLRKCMKKNQAHQKKLSINRRQQTYQIYENDENLEWLGSLVVIILICVLFLFSVIIEWEFS